MPCEYENKLCDDCPDVVKCESEAGKLKPTEEETYYCPNCGEVPETEIVTVPINGWMHKCSDTHSCSAYHSKAHYEALQRLNAKALQKNTT